MKPDQSNSPIVAAYHLGYVLVLTVLFLFLMLLTGKQQGLEKFEEGFFQRDHLIQNFNRLRMKVGDHVFNNVLIGKDGWMEYTGDHNLDDYQNVLNFSPQGLEAVAATIQECNQYAREHNMTFLIAVAPNKASIYPDKLPEQIQPVSDVSPVDQLNSFLRSHNIPEVLDLRPALRAGRQQGDVYYKMGTHWNEYGAYVAYETIINFLSQTYPDLDPYPAKFFRFRGNNSISRGDRELAGMLKATHLLLEPMLFSTRDLNEVYYETDFHLPITIHSFHKISWIPDSHLPSLLMYHDSFGDANLNGFLALNFSKGYYIHRNSASVFLNWPAIEQFSPNVVIYEIVERNLIWIQGEIAGCTQE